MIELKKLGEKTYCLENPVNIGFYLINDNELCVIDTGNSKDYGKLINKIIVENNWNLKYIINTHSHADHIGGNKYLQEKYNCQIYANKIESYFINCPILEPTMMFSASPSKEMKSHILYASESCCEDIAKINIKGIKIIDLKGHSFGQIGVLTSDDVLFAGDAYTSEKILEKYAIQYVYDIKDYVNSLEKIKNSNFNYYVPSHGNIEKNCKQTIEKNINNIKLIENEIIEIVKNEITFNKLLKEIFLTHHIKMNIIQYHLISATLKSFLTKLEEENKIEYLFIDNEMIIRFIQDK